MLRTKFLNFEMLCIHLSLDFQQQKVVTSSALSPNKGKGQKGAQMRNRTSRQLNQRKSLGGLSSAY
jgi:hypothetical protein